MPEIPITVPGVGESITEGVLARWLVADGSAIEAGEPLFELETDKATSVVPAPRGGILKILAQEGETVPIGATIGTIEPAAPAAPAPSSAAQAPARGTGQPPRAAEAPAPAQEVAERPLSPAVRRLVGERGIDVDRISATGPGGRITKGDVIAFLDSPEAQRALAPATPPLAAPAPSPPEKRAEPAPAEARRRDGPRETRQRMTGLRERIAERLVQAQHTAAILTTFNEADMERLTELRRRYKEPFQAKHGIGLGLMSFFVKAAIEALKAFPSVNARIEGNEIVTQNFYDIGVAVSTERGLLVPVLRDADQLSFAAIEKAIADFAAKARSGTISVNELQGGTFTITNGGIFGSLLSTPILNPPQSGILGMHAIKRRPVVVDDQIAIRPMMYLALSYDHRLIDGREAVGFLLRVKHCVEEPERIMLDI